MSDDLIKRSDVLSMIDAFERDFQQSWKVQFSADIRALPAVDLSERIEELKANIREAALEDALVAARQELVNGAYIYRGSYQEKPSNMLFHAERMVSKAINSLIGEKNE